MSPLRTMVGLALASLLLATGAAASRAVYFGGDVAGLVRQRPASIHITSDENLKGVHWVSWGGETARGRGTAVFSASDGVAPIPVQLTLSHVRRCAGKLRYLRLVIRPPKADTTSIRYTCRSPF